MVHENAMADQCIINLTCDIHISPYSFYVYSLPILAMLLERMLFTIRNMFIVVVKTTLSKVIHNLNAFESYEGQ